MEKLAKVAFSGSGFRLPAHIGALQAFHDEGFTITEVAGTSGGSIVAALFACGMSSDAMLRLALTYDWSTLLTFEPYSGFVKHRSYCSGDALLAFLQKYTKGAAFKDLKVKLRIIASDLVTEGEVEFSQDTSPSMPVAMAARASASIPFVYAPVQFGQYVLVDGGVCDNIPVTHLSKGGQQFGVYLESGIVAKVLIEPVDMLERAVDMILASSEYAHMGEDKKATMIKVNTGSAGSLNTTMSYAARLALFNAGYQAASSVLRQSPSKAS